LLIADSRSGGAGLPTQDGTNAGEHLGNIDRFGHAIIRTNIETVNTCLRIAGGNEGQYGNLVARLSRPSEKLQSAAAHETQVKKDNGIVSGANSEAPGARIAHPINGVTRVSELAEQMLTALQIVFNKKYAHDVTTVLRPPWA
jgi:hypothetical protein